ncbi:MAG: hypothetical protein RLZZ360_630 [Candidatus Parcubacteria bacterium]|jgi:hypothetical protein
MAEIKTKATKASVPAYIKQLANPEVRQDCVELVKLFRDVTGEKPVLWGTSIIGFGSYHYESTRSDQKGDWPLTAFAPRATNITLYIMPGFTEYEVLMKKLGKHKTGKSCLYIKRLADIDMAVLRTLITKSVADMKKRYAVSKVVNKK